jgi:hypothetical protein
LTPKTNSENDRRLAAVGAGGGVVSYFWKLCGVSIGSARRNAHKKTEPVQSEPDSDCSRETSTDCVRHVSRTTSSEECFSPIVCPKPEPPKKCPYQPICVLYGQNFASVERNYLMPRLTQICFQEIFLLPDAPIFFLQLITNDRANPANRAINLRNLENMRAQKGVSVFVSSLGSSLVEYLFDLFFSFHLTDCFHVNSFSTAVALSSEANLLRLFPILTPSIAACLSNKPSPMAPRRSSLCTTRASGLVG